MSASPIDECATGPFGLRVGRHAADEQVGAQAPDVDTQAVYRSVRGDEQVEDVEPLVDPYSA